jgi:hypothetical protein
LLLSVADTRRLTLYAAEQHVMRRGKLWFLHGASRLRAHVYPPMQSCFLTYISRVPTEHMPAMRPKAVVKPKPAKAGVAPAAEEGGVEGAAGAAGGEPGVAAAKPTRAITSFFAAAPAKAAAPQGGEDEEAEEEGGDEDMDEEEAADDVVVDVHLVDEE